MGASILEKKKGGGRTLGFCRETPGRMHLLDDPQVDGSDVVGMGLGDNKDLALMEGEEGRERLRLVKKQEKLMEDFRSFEWTGSLKRRYVWGDFRGKQIDIEPRNRR